MVEITAFHADAPNYDRHPPLTRYAAVDIGVAVCQNSLFSLNKKGRIGDRAGRLSVGSPCPMRSVSLRQTVGNRLLPASVAELAKIQTGQEQALGRRNLCKFSYKQTVSRGGLSDRFSRYDAHQSELSVRPVICCSERSGRQDGQLPSVWRAIGDPGSRAGGRFMPMRAAIRRAAPPFWQNGSLPGLWPAVDDPRTGRTTVRFGAEHPQFGWPSR